MTDTSRFSQLQQQGVTVISPTSTYIAPEVDIARIVGPDTVIYPGCRLAGRKLMISAGCSIGAEGPAHIDDCSVGEQVALKGGYFASSVFLKGSSLGFCAHVRSGCLIEEQASTAHSVGLKQTILFPFVTLGSIINFCDIFMAGGTSRSDHSEVGSSFIHFNFTPFGQSGDKATASLIGDVPRGVFLNQARIFLGGQGGLVGPLHVDYGTVLAAGFVYRSDHGPQQLVFGEPSDPFSRPFDGHRLSGISRRVPRNIRYIANLHALKCWYKSVRLPFAQDLEDPFLEQIYQHAMSIVEQNIAERIKQLGRLHASVEESIRLRTSQRDNRPAETAYQQAFLERWPVLKEHLSKVSETATHLPCPWQTIEGARRSGDYLRWMQSHSEAQRQAGTAWLSEIVDAATMPVLASEEAPGNRPSTAS